jgi:hypothetical protein
VLEPFGVALLEAKVRVLVGETGDARG